MKKETLTTYQHEISDFCHALKVLVENDRSITLKELRELSASLPEHAVIMGCLDREDSEWLVRSVWSKFSTLKDSQEWNELFDELVNIQNNGYHDHHDIITITDFMGSIEELEAHVKMNRR